MPTQTPAADDRPAAGASRGLAYPVASCVAGAGLALFAVTRVWSVQVTARPGLSDLRAVRTGAGQLSWLPALALVALAGAGALLATRGWARRVTGAVLLAVGVGLTVGAGLARTGSDPGAAGAAGTLWPVAAGCGGVLVALAGWWTVRHGHRWPAMDARYERATGSASGPPDAPGLRDAEGLRGVEGSRDAETPPPPGGQGQRRESAPMDTRSAWDALDRGDDPTVS